MKTITPILFIFCLASCFAQNNTSPKTGTDPLAEAEMKAAYRLKNFRANAHTGNYDAGHQTLELTVDPAVHFISGTITSAYTAKEALQTLTFDLNNVLTVSSVTQNGTALSFTQNNNDELVITLPQAVAAGATGTVVIKYSGAPDVNDDSFVTGLHNDVPVLWTLSEPYGAKEWWPCKQDLNDKIDGTDVYITAPSQYVALSNGLEQSQQQNSNGTKTTHFKHNYPIPAYLVAIAVTNYSVYTQTAGTAPHTFPVVNYLYPETLAQMQTEVAQTPSIMDFYEKTFETYPFAAEKYGHAQCGFGGGMEHTTVSFMGGFNRGLIAHELAHQWFGDKVTCGSWKDIWLNEGFATYLSGLTIEHLDGASGFYDWKYGMVSSITSLPDGSVYLTDNDTLSVDRIFSTRLTYNKGAMVLNMLRFKLGDTAFFNGLKNYLADSSLAYGYAKTPNLQAHLETAGGVSLAEFFNDWVYNQGYPSYNVTVSHGGTGTVLVTLSQTQSDPSVSFFEMPVPIMFTGPSGETYSTVLDNTVNNQQFTVPVPFSVAGAQVNASLDIISFNDTVTLSDAPFNMTDVSLYPNPAANELWLSLPQGLTVQRAVFYNALGQKVLETGSQLSWNVAKLAAGVHFITLITSEGTRQLKFIKL